MEDYSKGKRKMEDALEKFELLKQNIENFNARKILEIASNLKEYICKDPAIIGVCNAEVEQANYRKDLLEKVSTLQMNIIREETQYDSKKFVIDNLIISDFDKAKTDLADMADEEIKLNMFKEEKEPYLYSNITECQQHVETLHRVADNCKNGKYIVLLMGDFQSGKSTTLNALCDGRRISAIGDGLATSAVPISVTYAEKESLSIKWRTKKQFEIIFSHIKKYLTNFDWTKFDLDNTGNRQNLMEEIKSIRQSDNCPNIGEGDAKFLMLCDMVLYYYDSPELKNKKNALQFISDISEVTRFPEGGETKWKESGMSALTIDDAIFIFIDFAECYIPSETLRNLNCTIIDSPGLFSSSYDTTVTEMAMVKAHAIMYLLPYYKGIGQNVCNSLYTIKEKYQDVHRKLFIANNLRYTERNSFFDSNCEQIASMFGDDKLIIPYDAKLSLLTQIKRNYAEGKLAIKDCQHLLQVQGKGFRAKKISFNDFNQAWQYYTKIYENVECLGDITTFGTQEILKRCGFDELIMSLKEFIAKNEAYSVILSNGISVMQNEMERIIGDLNRLYVEPYNKSLDDMEELWKKRIENAEEFQKKIKDEANTHIFSTLEGLSLYERMAKEEYSKLFNSDFYEDMINNICGILYDNKKELVCTKSLINDTEKFKKRFEKLATPWITEKIVDLIKTKISYLNEIIKSEQDTTVSDKFTPYMKNLEIQLQEEWNELYKRDENFKMQDYFYVTKNLKNIINEKNNNSSTSAVKIKYDGINSKLIEGLVLEITITVTSISAMIASYISFIICDPTFTALFFSLLLGAGGLLVIGVAPDWARNKFIQVLSKKLKPQIDSDAVADCLKDMVNKQMKMILTKYIENLEVNIQKMRNDRDIALKQDPNKENLCFKAVENIAAIKKQLNKYEEYKQEHIQY